jgi:hypothetical protein
LGAASGEPGAVAAAAAAAAGGLRVAVGAAPAGRLDRALTRELLDLVAMNVQALKALQAGHALGGLQRLGAQF